MLVRHGDGGVADERRFAGEHFVEYATQRVDVGASVDPFAAGLFGRQVLRRADDRGGLGDRIAGVSQRSGDAEELGDMFGQFLRAILLGILLIYCVLVLLFRDFLQPISMLLVIMLAPAGAFLALGLVQEPLSLPVMIGLLMLIGIVIKNSILLVDFAIEAERMHGLSRHEAIMDAVRKRSRPVVMTTIAMIAGMVPAAMTTAGAGAFRHGMAIAVIGGLAVSTVLSLVFVPAMYTLIDDLSRFIKGLFKDVATVTPDEKSSALREEIQRRASQAAAE